MSEMHEWEPIITSSDGRDGFGRFVVPGGWLYGKDDSHDTEAYVFVPAPPRLVALDVDTTMKDPQTAVIYINPATVACVKQCVGEPAYCWVEVVPTWSPLPDGDDFSERMSAYNVKGTPAEVAAKLGLA